MSVGNPRTWVAGEILTAQLMNEEVRDQFANFVPTGSIIMWPSAAAPSEWLLCDGSEVSRTTYADLFAEIGTTYGSGDGSTTFNLPNLKGRVPVGLDSGQTEFDALAETGGAKTHTLTTGEMPVHAHSASSGTESADHVHNVNHGHSASSSWVGDHAHSQNIADAGGLGGGGSLVRKGWAAGGEATAGGGGHAHTITVNANNFNSAGRSAAHTHAITVNNSGSGGAHNNLQPYLVLNFIIRT